MVVAQAVDVNMFGPASVTIDKAASSLAVTMPSSSSSTSSTHQGTSTDPTAMNAGNALMQQVIDGFVVPPKLSETLHAVRKD